MTGSVQIRRATADDIHVVWEIRTIAIREICTAHYPEGEAEAWASAPMRDDFGDVFTQQECFIAEIGGNPVAFGFFHAGEGMLNALFVHPLHTGKGIGRWLLTVIEDKARALSVPKITLLASLNAVPFYTAAGFRSLGPDKHVHNGGRELDCVKMEKLLT